jgi:outer membrane protein TolC
MDFMRKYFLMVVLLGIISELSGQENKGVIRLSISEAQSLAIENNRNVQSAKVDVDIATKQVKENVATGLPQLSLAANYQHQFVVPELSFGQYLDVNSLPDQGFLTKDDILDAYKDSPVVPLGVPDNTTFDFTLSQLIFSGEYIVGLHAARVVKQVSEKALVKTENEMKETVAGTYYLILVLGESINVLKASMESVSQTYNEMSRMNAEGFNEETDVDQIKINMSNLTRLLTSTESQREISTKLLKYQLGLDFNQQVELTDSLQVFIQEGNMPYLGETIFDVKKNIDYMILNDRRDISELLVKRSKSQYLPAIFAFYQRHEQTNAPSFNFAVKDLVGITLNFPIFTSGQRSARVSQAKLNLEKSELSLRDAEQGLILEFETALSNYQAAYNNFITNRESIVLTKRIYDKTLIKYHEGVSTSFELAQNQSQYLIAETAYYNSILNLLNAKAKIDRILGIN